MSRLFCHLLGRHHPSVIVVVGFSNDHPVTAVVCPHCWRPNATHVGY
jgi:hypothetical protein